MSKNAIVPGGYDLNMEMSLYLGFGLDCNPSQPIPAELKDVKRRARLVHAIDGPIVRDFYIPVEHYCGFIGMHILKVSHLTPKFLPKEMDALHQVSIALRLWAGCLSAAKTIAYKTAAGKNKDADRLAIMARIENFAKNDLFYRAGVEAAVAFKRLRRQKVYLDCFVPAEQYTVMRYVR